MASSSGGIRMHVGDCAICGGEDKVLASKCRRCGKRACATPVCQRAIIRVASCRVPKMFLPR